MTRRLADAAGYRRGMVLGLTMAEIMMLLVFLMLLAATALLLRRAESQTALASATADRALGSEKLAMLQARIAVLEADARTSQAMLFQTRTLAAQTEQARANAEARGKSLDASLQAANAAVAAARTEAQAMQGQNAQMRNELGRLHGNVGSGLPYCWTSPDGRPIAVLRVQLRDGGVLAAEPDPRPRPGDAAWAKLDGMTRGVLQPIEVFMAQVAPFIAQSDAERCRYAVDVIDGTSANNKSGYKGLMNRLWGSFLLREVGG